MNKNIVSVIICITLFTLKPLFAAHPLITDDTGTQGLGGIEIELAGEYGYENENSAKEYCTEAGLSLSAGIYKSIDIILCLPYQWVKSSSQESRCFKHGLGDLFCDFKWRFYETGPFSLAAKPGLILPTGNDARELGAGEIGYTCYIIGTFEIEPLAVHINAGYMRNNNKLDEREHLWHFSIATEYGLSERISAVSNIGFERNPVKNNHMIPVFLVGGLVYVISDHCDIDAGVKCGLTKPETDIAVLAGFTFHFETIRSEMEIQ